MKDNRGAAFAKAAIRLTQAVPGMTCQIPDEGSVADVYLRLEALLADEGHKGANPKTVDAIMALIS